MDATMARVLPLFGTDTDALVKRWEHHPALRELRDAKERRKMALWLDSTSRQESIVREVMTSIDAEMREHDLKLSRTRVGRIQIRLENLMAEVVAFLDRLLL